MVRPAPGAPRSGDGASPQAPWGACCGVRHNTRILSRPESEACLDEIRSGGACPPDKTVALLRRRGGPAPRPGPPDKHLRAQIGPEAFTNLRLQCPLQGMALSGSLYTDGVSVQVRSTTRGPAGRVGPDDAIGPPHKPDQSALACLLTAAHARPDGLTSALGRHRSRQT